jgi:hypothetical protein
MEISGKLNRTAERYLELLRCHGMELTEPERKCIAHICHIGFMSPLEIRELPMEVELTASNARPGQARAGGESSKRRASPTWWRSSNRWASEARSLRFLHRL